MNIFFNFRPMMMIQNENLLYKDERSHLLNHNTRERAHARAKNRWNWVFPEKVNSLPFSRNLHLIVKVTSKCIQWSVHEWKYSQCEIFSCWYQEICARALVRAKFRRHECILFEEVFIRVSLKRFLYNFLWLRGFYTIFSEEFLYDLIDLTMVELPIKYEVLQ